MREYGDRVQLGFTLQQEDVTKYTYLQVRTPSPDSKYANKQLIVVNCGLTSFRTIKKQLNKAYKLLQDSTIESDSSKALDSFLTEVLSWGLSASKLPIHHGLKSPGRKSWWTAPIPYIAEVPKLVEAPMVFAWPS
jgi:hypothetical protein